MEPLLEMKQVTKRFSGRNQMNRPAVDSVSFSIYPGECVGLVGASGAGKSTVAKLAARLVDVTDGQIFFDGRDITHICGKELQALYGHMQMIFQSPASSFDPRQTLGESVGEGLKNRGIGKKERREIVGRLLQSCGLASEYACAYPHEVSGGQCQRAAIARALAVKPRLIICDEATSALDVTMQRQIIALLRQLKQERHISYLFICHNLAVAQQFCDRIVVMNEGKVVETGKTEDIICRPRENYTKMLIEASL